MLALPAHCSRKETVNSSEVLPHEVTKETSSHAPRPEMTAQKLYSAVFWAKVALDSVTSDWLSA